MKISKTALELAKEHGIEHLAENIIYMSPDNFKVYIQDKRFSEQLIPKIKQIRTKGRNVMASHNSKQRKDTKLEDLKRILEEKEREYEILQKVEEEKRKVKERLKQDAIINSILLNLEGKDYICNTCHCINNIECLHIHVVTVMNKQH